MPEKVEKSERLLNLLALFLASRTPVPFSAIAGRVIGYDDGAELDSLEKRFDRDRADLRDLGVNVEYATGGEMSAGYFVRKESVFQRRVTLTNEDAMLLSLAGRVGAAATGGGPLFDALRSALRKLAVDVPPLSLQSEEHPVPVLRADAADARATATVAALAQAIATGRRLAFSYRGMRDDRARKRVVSPWGLGLFRAAWYLAGFDHDRRQIRVFKVARIAGRVDADRGGARPEDVVPDDFDMHDHVPREAFDVGAGPPRTVVLRVAGSPDRAAFAPGVAPEIVSRDAGGAVVSVKVRRPLALVPWVLSCGGDVEVMKPADLRKAVREAASTLARGGRA